MPQDMIKHAYTIADLDGDPLGKSSIYKAIGHGQLRAIKFGRRTFILPADWQRFLAGLPAIAPTAPAAPASAATNGRRPRGRPRKIPAASPASERVPFSEEGADVAAAPAPAGPSCDGSHLRQPDRVPKRSAKNAERGAA
jgi:hypothetical protein